MGVFLKDLVHLIAALLFLGALDGLGVGVLDGLYLLVVGVEAGDHVPHGLDLLDELLVYLVLLPLVLVLLLPVQVVFRGRATHQR